MYPSTHLLTETLVSDRLRDADANRIAREVQSPEVAPRWWRLRTSKTLVKAPGPGRIGDARRATLKSLETPA